MACNWHVITCHYMHYMPLHAIEDANVLVEQQADITTGDIYNQPRARGE